MNPILIGHHELKNRYCFKGILELAAPLRISSGAASAETDAPFIRTFDGIPYIPGSSLRGAVRSEVERILAAAGQSAGLRSCTLFEKGDCEKGDCAEKFRNKRKKLDQNEDMNSDARDKAMKKFIAQKLCDTCRLFGTTEFASKLVFQDCLPTDPTGIQEHSRIRDSVGIDRDTGAASDRAKFDYEVIEGAAGCPAFQFEMTAENVGESETKVINLVLALLKTGLTVGGKRAAGFGKIRLRERCVVTGFDNAQAVWNALAAGQDPLGPIAWKEGISC